ncbi:MAG: methyltransferase domain-containing protein [Phycisphaera sp.]|nr:methyltransferase domain-containing protein [Phycisphaera sp.]
MTRHTDMTRRTALIALVVCCAAAPLAWSQDNEKKDAPPARTEYKGRTIAHTMHWSGAPWLERATREAEEKSSLLLKELRLRPGDVVCDLGCGSGYHTLRMAKVVGPTGKVYGEDIQKEMLNFLMDNAKKAEVTNVVPVLGELWDPKLPDGSCDLILLVDVYHELSHPELMLQAMRKALKPRGHVALVEYRAEDPDVPIKKLHKMSKEQILKEWLPNGFKLERQFDGLPWQHLMFFQRDDAPAEEGSKDGDKPTAPEKKTE